MENRYTNGHKGFITLLDNDWDKMIINDLIDEFNSVMNSEVMGDLNGI